MAPRSLARERSRCMSALTGALPRERSYGSYMREHMFTNELYIVFTLYIALGYYIPKHIGRLGFVPGSYRCQVQRLTHCSISARGYECVKILLSLRSPTVCVFWIIIIHLLYKIQMIKRSSKDIMIFIEAFAA